MIERIKEFLENVVAGLIALPILAVYGCIICIKTILEGVCEFVKAFRELLIIALIVLLIIDGAHYSAGVSIAIVVIFVLLTIVNGENNAY